MWTPLVNTRHPYCLWMTPWMYPPEAQHKHWQGGVDTWRLYHQTCLAIGQSQRDTCHRMTTTITTWVANQSPYLIIIMSWMGMINCFPWINISHVPSCFYYGDLYSTMRSTLFSQWCPWTSHMSSYHICRSWCHTWEVDCVYKCIIFYMI